MVIVSQKSKTSYDIDKPNFKRSFAEFTPADFNLKLHDRLNDFLFKNVAINGNNFDQVNKFHSIKTQSIDKLRRSSVG